ncbi:MAG: methyltransferase domain-containing protein [Vicinamibacterales bacterium]
MSVPDLQKRFYPDAAEQDPVVVMLSLVQAAARPDSVVLDVGAGAGVRNQYALRGNVGRMLGVDLDRRVVDNPLLDEGLLLDGIRIPLPDASVDIAFSIYVQEHLEYPLLYARDVFRILRPGGAYFFVTPNRYHYVSLIASLTPTLFHEYVNRKRGIPSTDTFATFYRLNTKRAVQRIFPEAGFEIRDLRMIECQPNYLMFNRVAFLAGVLYERTVNRRPWLDRFRVNIVGECRRPATMPGRV